jgi:hypothetical protein
MTPLIPEQMDAMIQLWKNIMPLSIPLPSTQTFFLWLTAHEQKFVQTAIIQTAKKMATNIYQGRPLVENAAPRYVSSILGARRVRARQVDLAIRYGLEQLKIEKRDKWRDDEDPPIEKAAVRDMAVRETSMRSVEEKLRALRPNTTVTVQNMVEFYEDDGVLKARPQ